jgi:TonB family protein
MIRMKRHHLQNAPKKSRRFAAGLVAFALVIFVALPLRAADDHSDRAIKQRVSPIYPELAKRMRVSGVVRVSATVAPDGSVSATKTVSGNHMLAGAAEDAVHKWKFVSAPDESTVEVDINFALAQ